jgi:predicted Zn-dependent protease
MNAKFCMAIILVSITATIFIACSTNAITGRSQLSLVSDAEVMQQSSLQYKQFLSSNKVVSGTTNRGAVSVNTVGRKIVTAINKYYQENGLSKELEGFEWEINTVENKEVNAWCMPGGKIVVYTGILPVTKNDAGLAVVMGHEIAHALAKHGKERLSQGLVQQLGGVALSVAMANKSAESQQLWGAAYGLGSQYGAMLPFSRKNELEADKFGLMFSALAGYDPNEAVDFWKRMAAVGGGQAPPEFASTHPSDETRIAQLQKIMPEVVSKYYKK